MNALDRVVLFGSLKYSSTEFQSDRKLRWIGNPAYTYHGPLLINYLVKELDRK